MCFRLLSKAKRVLRRGQHFDIEDSNQVPGLEREVAQARESSRGASSSSLHALFASKSALGKKVDQIEDTNKAGCIGSKTAGDNTLTNDPTPERQLAEKSDKASQVLVTNGGQTRNFNLLPPGFASFPPVDPFGGLSKTIAGATLLHSFPSCLAAVPTRLKFSSFC